VRNGGEEGLDAVAPYAWSILLHHNEHEHFLLAEYANNEVTLEVPVQSHALGAPLWYEVRLTMRTSSGQTLSRTVKLMPETTTIQVQSWPGPATILVDQQEKTPNEMTMVIVGQEHTLEAPAKIIHDQKVGVFRNWVVTPSWPVASAEVESVIVTDRIYTLVAPAEANTYVAYYEYLEPATPNFLPAVRR
jgi:hypothetical protein